MKWVVKLERYQWINHSKSCPVFKAYLPVNSFAHSSSFVPVVVLCVDWAIAWDLTLLCPEEESFCFPRGRCKPFPGNQIGTSPNTTGGLHLWPRVFSRDKKEIPLWPVAPSKLKCCTISRQVRWEINPYNLLMFVIYMYLRSNLHPSKNKLSEHYHNFI